jgi:hypothetical protein
VGRPGHGRGPERPGPVCRVARAQRGLAAVPRASRQRGVVGEDKSSYVDLGYKIKKPKLRRKPGRLRNSRIKSYDEATTGKKRRPCSECNELGHIAKHYIAKEVQLLVKRGTTHLLKMNHLHKLQCESCSFVFFSSLLLLI